MKKVFLVFVALCVLTAVLCGCVVDNGEGKYEKLNKMVADVNKNFTLTVKTDADKADALTSVFNVSTNGAKLTVEYSVEQLADFSNGIPESYKKTVSGKIVVENGSVVEQSGQAVDFALEKIADLGFDFQENYFTNVNLTETAFTANVTNVSAFWGSSVSATNMTVSVNFEDALQKIDIAYTSESGASVQVTYEFC